MRFLLRAVRVPHRENTLSEYACEAGAEIIGPEQEKNVKGMNSTAQFLSTAAKIPNYTRCPY